MSCYTFICHPDRFFLVLRHDLPFGNAILLLLLMPLLFGVSLVCCQQWVRSCRNRARTDQTLADLFGPMGVFICVTPLIAFADYCFLREFRSDAPYEWVLCLTVYTWLPYWFVLIPYAIWQLHWLTYRAMKVLCVGTSLWITWLCWVAARAEPSLAWWQDLLLVLPLVAPVWAICVSTILERPAMLSACLRWRRKKGKSITLFYLAGPSLTEVAVTVRSFESALDKVTVALKVSPLRFRVPVYLFPDRVTLHKYVGTPNRGEGSVGYSHDDAISLAVFKADALTGSAAHEFTHVLRFQRVARKLIGLLDEGLACYVEHLLYGTPYGAGNDEVALPASWHTMTRYTLFYEWLYTQHPENEAHRSYRYAFLMASYLINKFGMEKYLELCRKSATDNEQEAGEKFAQAVQDVYGQSATALEAAWRDTLGEGKAISSLTTRHIELAREVGELKSQVRHLKHQLEGQQVLKLELDTQRTRHDHSNIHTDGTDTGL